MFMALWPKMKLAQYVLSACGSVFGLKSPTVGFSLFVEVVVPSFGACLYARQVP